MSSYEDEVIPLRSWLLTLAHRQFPRADAEDLVQDTLERTWKNWYLYRPDGRLKAWLRTIMYNVYINQYRKAKRMPVMTATYRDLAEAENDFYFSGEDNRAPSAEVVALDELRDSDVWMALDNLPLEFREVLKLISEGYHYKEIAAYLDVPLGTVMSRLHRARHKMREALNEIVI